jgi:branched-subunit amino acid transport protein AzlD
MVFALVYIGAFVFAISAIYIAKRNRGGTLRGGLNRAVDFAIFSIISLQTFVSVSNPAAPHTSDELRSLVKILLTYANLDTRNAGVHPACIGDYLFLQACILMSILLCMNIFTAFIILQRKTHPTIIRVAIISTLAHIFWLALSL